ncbi:hypothetical protein MP228_003020 [Amoeboaphelidium protococcarum]|nr:hypothetical protein MP228_003020 [Amoeboaphelidium protococcarum]
MLASPRVVIFGGNGYIGKHLLRQLLNSSSNKYKIAIASRSGIKRADNGGNSSPIEHIKCDITQYDQVQDALKECDVAVNLVGIMEQTGGSNTFSAVQRDGPLNVAKALATRNAQRVGKFVHVSAIGANLNGPTPYTVTKALGEQAIIDACRGSQNLSSIIVRPGLVIGPNDSFLNRFANLTALFPVFPIFGSGKSLYQPIYVEDLCKVIKNSIEHQTAPSNYALVEVGGSQVYTFKDLISRTTRWWGMKSGSLMRSLMPPFFVHVPVAVALIQARIFELITPYNSSLRITTDQVRMLQLDNNVHGSTLSEAIKVAVIEHSEGVDPLTIKESVSKDVAFKSVDDLYSAGKWKV